MNTIGATTVGQNPFQFLQPTTGQQNSSPSSTTATLAPATATDPTSQLLSATGKHRHHHRGSGHGKSDSGGVSDLLDAVTSALNSADPSADANQVIQDTITKLLSGDGADTDPPAANSNTVTLTGAPGTATTAQSFAATLKAHGVDLSQFKADLTAAVKNVQNGQINPAAALKSIAPGSALNLTA